MATSVSTATLSQSLRYQLTRMQAELVKANSEVASGRVADVGLSLGARTTQSISLNRDMARLDGIVDQNSLASTRLTTTQDALSQLIGRAQSLRSTLSAGLSGNAASSISMADAKTTLSTMTSMLNTTVNGEYIFAGINTDVRPLGDYTATGSPAKAAFDAGFQGFFGFSQNDPAAANITSAQMESFLDTVVVPQFMGTDWQANWSDATDQTITSRISLNETASTSVSANADGIRKLAMVATTIFDLFSSSTMSDAAKSTLMTRGVTMVSDAIDDITALQSRTGIVQKQVTDASARLKTQMNVLDGAIGKLEGVDPYEASTRVNSLLDQIETSYALTARLQKLSLTKFL
ncbi:MAG: flagellar hook-associated family protein [Rhizobiales bacterium]|nr:flagellar hook-associated family protein [Hyphomicrobiales bacterium]